MAFKFYIDDQLVDSPVNDKDLLTTIRRQFSSVLITQDADVEWNNDNAIPSGVTGAFNYLYTIFTSSTCGEATLKIYDELSPTDIRLIYTGVIKIANCSVDEQRKTIKCKVEDNSFYAYINNNRNIKVNFAGEATKSNQSLTPITFYDVDLFNTVNCVYGSGSGSTYKGFRAIDVIDFIVRAITDNKVTAQSDYFDNMTNQPFIFIGYALATSYTAYPNSPDPFIELSFDEIFSELNKLYSLGFYIDDSTPSAPILKIESYDDTFNGNLLITLDDVKELTTSATINENYATVRAGSDQTTSGVQALYPFPDEISYYGWREEVYFPQGQCNISNELDLKNRFVIDTNSIQDVLIQGGTDFLNSIFVIECDNVDTINLTATGVQHDPFNNGDCFYNIGLNNFNKLNRHKSKFDTQLGNFFGNLLGTFRALLGSSNADTRRYQGVGPNTIYSLPYVGGSLFSGSFDADYPNVTTAGGFNNGGYYDNVLFKYTAPTDGVYTFEHRLFYDVYNMTNANEYFRVYAILRHYDSLNNLISIQTSTPTVSTVNGQWSNSLNSIFTMVTGDYIDARYAIEYQFWTQVNNPDVQNPRYLDLQFTSYFECNGVPDGLGIIATGTKINKYIHEFDYHLSPTDFLTIKANPTKRINFTKDGETKYGWIQELKHNDWNGSTKIKLLSDNATLTQ